MHISRVRGAGPCWLLSSFRAAEAVLSRGGRNQVEEESEQVLRRFSSHPNCSMVRQSTSFHENQLLTIQVGAFGKDDIGTEILSGNAESEWQGKRELPRTKVLS